MSSPDEKSIRILLVDDHVIVRAGLRILIESHPGFVVVGEAGNREEALSIASLEGPEVILLDLDLAGESGLALLPELLLIASCPRVLVLTALTDPEQHRKAFQLGAMGLVLKDQATDTLVRAIEKVGEGEVWLDSSTMAKVIVKSQEPGKPEKTDPEAARIASLTPREREILRLLGNGLTNRQIADRLFISQATVRHHVESLYNKLGLSSRFLLILYAYRHGLADPPP